MLTTRFGIEVELTGITRKQAAKTAAAFLGGRVESSGDIEGRRDERTEN